LGQLSPTCSSRGAELSLRISFFGISVGDAYNVARLWTRPVDFVFLANAFHGVPDKPRLARAVKDTLKPLGRFAIVNWHPRRKQPSWASRADREPNRACGRNRQSRPPKPMVLNSAS